MAKFNSYIWIKFFITVLYELMYAVLYVTIASVHKNINTSKKHYGTYLYLLIISTDSIFIVEKVCDFDLYKKITIDLDYFPTYTIVKTHDVNITKMQVHTVSSSPYSSNMSYSTCFHHLHHSSRLPYMYLRMLWENDHIKLRAIICRNEAQHKPLLILN